MDSPDYEYALKKADENDEPIKLKRSPKQYAMIICAAIVFPLIMVLFSESIESYAPRFSIKILSILVGSLFGFWVTELYQHHKMRRNAENKIRITRERYNEKRIELETKRDECVKDLHILRNINITLENNTKNYLKKIGINCANHEEIIAFLDTVLTKKDDIDIDFEEILRADLSITKHHYGLLRKGGEIHKKYKTQIDLASIFCRLSKTSFWATSTDRVSSFQTHNYYYYNALFEISETLNKCECSLFGKKLPCFARVFIGDLHSFAADLIDNPETFFDLYRMHVIWGKNQDPHFIPIRFCLDKDHSGYFSYSKIIEQNHILSREPKAIMKDFMLVDDRLVYGREGDYSEDPMALRLSTNKGVIDAYKKIFLDVWDNSLSIEQLSQKILSCNYPGFDEAKQQEFVNLCKIAESKLSIPQDYTIRNAQGELTFPSETRIGANFFDQVCYHISKSTNLIVAVDRADRKTGNLSHAWLHSREYNKFHKACESAAMKGAEVYRLFILEKDLKRSVKKTEMLDFIRLNADSKINIGFIQKKYLSSPELELEYIYDFILINMPGGPAVFKDGYIETPLYKERLMENMDECLGFELLGDQSFIAAGLNWEDNLIAKDLLTCRLMKFMNIWNDSNVIKLNGFNKREIEELINELYA